jgi:hypothetical protein
MRPGGSSGGSHCPDYLSRLDKIPLLYLNLAEVQVNGRYTLTMVDANRIAM